MPKRVVAISGALEKKSCTSGLLRACLQAQHPELAFKVFDISSFPIFNMDIVLDSGYPKEIQALRDAIFEADGMLYAVS